MGIKAKTLVATALTSLALIAGAPSPAHANASAPECESGGSSFYCIGQSVGTTNWTVSTLYPSGWITSNPVTGGGFLRMSCASNRLVQVSYSYVSGGVTIYSDAGGVYCNPGPWQ